MQKTDESGKNLTDSGVVPIGGLFKIFIEASSVILIVGFVCSALIMNAVFRDWGISYLAIASTPDVLMDGLYFLFDLGLGFLFVAVAAILPLLSHTSPKTRNRFMDTLHFSPFLFAIMLVILTLNFVFAAAGDVVFPDAASNPAMAQLKDGYATPAKVTYGFALFFAGGFVGTIGSISALRIKRAERPHSIKGWVYIVAFGANAALLSAGLNGVVTLRRDVGFFDQFIELPGGKAPCENAAGQIVWVGSDFSIVRCEPDDRVVLTRSDQLLAARPKLDRAVSCTHPWNYGFGRCYFSAGSSNVAHSKAKP